MIEKLGTFRDERYLEYVRGLRCCNCGAANPEAHHVTPKGMGGGRLDDWTAVPLCNTCHGRWHTRGVDTFREETGVDLWKINSKLVRRYVRKNWRRA